MKTILNLRPKPVTKFGVTHESTYGLNCTFNADVEKNQSIRIYGTYGQREAVAFDRTFKIGDKVEYDSYNLIYTGEIVAIGEKTVKIHKGNYQPEHNVVLDLFWFVNKNWGFDLERIGKHNREELMCI